MRGFIFSLLIFSTIAIPYFWKHQNPATFVERELNQNWQFRRLDSEEWLSAKVPGLVQSDLVVNKKLDNPLLFDNEKQSIALENADWEYKTTFTVSDEELKKHHLELDFKGLDTYTEIYLNNVLIQKTDNMFISYLVNCKKHIKSGENELRIIFRSATRLGMEKLKKSPYLIPAVNELADNDKKTSVFTRKAPYHYGWDWGPRIVTAGIWRPIILRSWEAAHISDTYFELQSVTKIKANYDAQIEIIAAKKGEALLQLNVEDRVVITKKMFLKKGFNKVKVNFDIMNPKIWWPNGYGEQPLYAIKAKLFFQNNLMHEVDKKIGIRKIELVQEKDSLGKSFKFRVNGVDIFMKGSNYIPSDNILTDINTERYEKVLKAATDANMNMLRVWGGAIYENDEFYDLCDKKGILVWQDFMFACSMSPGDSSHLLNLKSEFDYNVKRLRQHPSLALWCGNNENMVAWYGWGLQKKYKLNASDSTDIMKTYMKIFYDLIPNSIKQNDSTRAYWPSSPGSGYAFNELPNEKSGDVHDWWIWFGQASFKDLISRKQRFISEYGLQSYPETKTMQSFATKSDTSYDSPIFDYKQRSVMNERKDSKGNIFNGNDMILAYINMYYKTPKNLTDFVYLSQMVQAKGLKDIIEGHRSHKPYCWGSLYWQIDDCWPTMSWSSIDYYYRWKAAHYAVKKAYEDLVIYPKLMGNLVDISVLSDKLVDVELKVGYKLMDFSGNVLATAETPIVAEQNANTHAFTKNTDELLAKVDKSKTLLYVYAKNNNGEVLTQNILHFLEPKDLKLEMPTISKKIRQIEDGGIEIELSSNTFASGVYLKHDADECFFSDNYFDLLPNTIKTIKVTNCKELRKLEQNLTIKSLANTL